MRKFFKSLKNGFIVTLIIALCIISFTGCTASIKGTLKNGSWSSNKNQVSARYDNFDGEIKLKLEFAKGTRIKFTIKIESISGELTFALSDNASAIHTISDGVLYDKNSGSALYLIITAVNHCGSFNVIAETFVS